MRLEVRGGMLFAPVPPATPVEWQEFFATASLVSPEQLKHWLEHDTSYCQQTLMVTAETNEANKTRLYSEWLRQILWYKAKEKHNGVRTQG